jgi:AraC-like DNA-binding protein
MVFILTLTLLIAIYNGFNLARLKPAILTNTMVWCTNFLIGINSICIIGYRLFFPDIVYFNQLAPFLAFYGPLVYLMIIAYDRNKIPAKVILLHLALPLVLLLVFIVVLICNWMGTRLDSSDLFLFKIASIGSTFFYTVLIAVKNHGRKVHRSFKIFMIGILILLTWRIMILVFFNLYGNRMAVNRNVLSAMVYSIMLLSSLLMYAYGVQYRKRNRQPGIDQPDLTLPRYKKSILSAEDLAYHEQKITDLMGKDRLYLNPELSLQELATALKIPKHYLTQVLNVRMKQGYHNYINLLRVEHACQLMKSKSDLTLQEIASVSGFNANVTFYRAFKTFKHMSPSEYLAKL